MKEVHFVMYDACLATYNLCKENWTVFC